MPERDYGLADIVQRSGTARAGLLRDLGQAQAQNRLALGAAQAQGYQDQGQRSALLAGSLAKIVGGTVDAYQDQQKIKIAQQAEVRKAQADAETAARDQKRTDIAAQDLALKQHAEALKAQDAALGVFTNLGQHALDHPEAWPTVLSAVSALSPEIVKTYGLTPDFDPEKITVAMQAGTDHKTQIEADKLALAQREQLDKETGPTAVADQLKNMIQFATVDKTPEGLAARAKVINSWVPVKGHEEAFNKAREMFNAAPQNPDALRALALTPEQNVQAEQNAATGARLEATAVETARHNKAMEGYEQAKLKQGADATKAAAGNVAEDARVTVSGKKYLDLGDYDTAATKQAARAAAKELGIPALDKETAAGLRAADTAKLNLNAMWSQIQSKLPKDASGRAVAGPANKLKAYFQTDEDIAAFNSWRAGAIQAVQALVEKGMGFRLNQAEINMIMQNDMPQITDTVGTAQTRINNVLKLIHNKEDTAIVRDRSTLGGGKISVKAPDGSMHEFDTPAQADAFKKLAGIK